MSRGNPTLQARCSTDVRDAVRVAAAQRGETVTAFVLTAVLERLARLGGLPDDRGIER